MSQVIQTPDFNSTAWKNLFDELWEVVGPVLEKPPQVRRLFDPVVYGPSQIPDQATLFFAGREPAQMNPPLPVAEESSSQERSWHLYSENEGPSADVQIQADNHVPADLPDPDEQDSSSFEYYNDEEELPPPKRQRVHPATDDEYLHFAVDVLRASSPMPTGRHFARECNLSYSEPHKCFVSSILIFILVFMISLFTGYNRVTNKILIISISLFFQQAWTFPSDSVILAPAFGEQSTLPSIFTKDSSTDFEDCSPSPTFLPEVSAVPEPVDDDPTPSFLDYSTLPSLPTVDSSINFHSAVPFPDFSHDTSTPYPAISFEDTPAPAAMDQDLDEPAPASVLDSQLSMYLDYFNNTIPNIQISS